MIKMALRPNNILRHFNIFWLGFATASNIKPSTRYGIATTSMAFSFRAFIKSRFNR